MKILVTAGPTREPLDPARFLSNPATGKMGYAIAQAALEHGHEVVLVSGPTALTPPDGARLVWATTAEDMMQAVHDSLPGSHALIMAAAVCDWRPAKRHAAKMKKERMPPTLQLERTRDILKSLSSLKGQRLHVGFAAETDDLAEKGRRKLAEKGLDLVVANDVSRLDAGFGADTNKVLFLPANGPDEDLPLMTKQKLAHRIVAWIEAAARGTGQ